jgi:predicted lipoprotein with Yx(FWY)xxD motif
MIEGSQMPRSSTEAVPGRPASFKAVLVAVLTGVAVAAFAGLAFAQSFTLSVAKNAPVKNTAGVTKHENIAIFAKRAVYDLTGNNLKNCTNKGNPSCFHFWPPVTIASGKPTAATGIKGKLGTIHRDGFTQVTLNGRPLYTFSLDKANRAATGEGIKSFGGTWHVVSGGGSSKAATTTTSTTTTSTMMGTTTTCTPGPPPYCY